MSIYALGSAAVVVSSQTQAQIQAGRTLHCQYYIPDHLILFYFQPNQLTLACEDIYLGM